MMKSHRKPANGIPPNAVKLAEFKVEFGTAKPAICPVCRYICVLSLVLSFPATLLCVAQLFPVLAAIDGPLLVDNAIRWLPHGLELEFNGTQLSLRPDRRARSDEPDADDDTLADLLLARLIARRLLTPKVSIYTMAVLGLAMKLRSRQFILKHWLTFSARKRPALRIPTSASWTP